MPHRLHTWEPLLFNSILPQNTMTKHTCGLLKFWLAGKWPKGQLQVTKYSSNNSRSSNNFQQQNKLHLLIPLLMCFQEWKLAFALVFHWSDNRQTSSKYNWIITEPIRKSTEVAITTTCLSPIHSDWMCRSQWASNQVVNGLEVNCGCRCAQPAVLQTDMAHIEGKHIGRPSNSVCLSVCLTVHCNIIVVVFIFPAEIFEPLEGGKTWFSRVPELQKHAWRERRSANSSG